MPVKPIRLPISESDTTDPATYISHLFETRDIVELRLLRGKAPKTETEKYWTTPADFEDLLPKLIKKNQQGWNIYVGPNPRRERGKSGDTNVLLARCLFVDFDHIGGDGLGMSDAAETIIDNMGLPQPTMIINSGHGVHCFWRLSEPMTDMSAWTARQKALIRALESDKAIHNPERIMRLPGFMNMKAEPIECYIVSLNGVPYRANS